MIYRFYMMTVDHEFGDLDFVGNYSDTMIKETGDQDWGIVYAWSEDSDAEDYDEDSDAEDVKNADGPPEFVLLRQDGKWERRRVIATPNDDGWSMEFVEV